jgi:hypothetical protein
LEPPDVSSPSPPTKRVRTRQVQKKVTSKKVINKKAKKQLQDLLTE